MKYHGKWDQYQHIPADYSWYTQTRAYNPRGQLTRLTSTGSTARMYPYPVAQPVDLEYCYSASANDGRITQMKDWIGGEEANYQYDPLGRLTQAQTTGPEWDQNFAYDGFGNLRSEVASKGTAPTGYHNYDALTNRLTDSRTSYDANGNLTAMPGLAMTYDVENRLIQTTQHTTRQKTPVSQC
jgi:YD repeat-containing protein